MRSSHIPFAHNLFKSVLNEGSFTLDATCGNGHDTLFLCQLITKGRILAVDLQKEAIDKTKDRVQESYPKANVEYIQTCHSKIAQLTEPETVDLIIYNLGYLPGSDKRVITAPSSTIKSLESALTLLRPGGYIIVTTYSGHEGGLEEERAVLAFAASLSSNQFTVSHTRWISLENSPTVLAINKL